MKKVLAIVLALVMAFSMSAIAFADGEAETPSVPAGDVNVENNGNTSGDSAENNGTIIGTQINN